jgi:hypothetical protein
VSFQGYDGTQWASGTLTGITATATENWTSTARGGQLQILTTPNTTTAAVERMTINAGNVGIGISNPDTRLTISAATIGGSAGNTSRASRISTLDGINTQLFDGTFRRHTAGRTGMKPYRIQRTIRRHQLKGL